MTQNIFREVSLKRLSSPEQLDQLIKVTSPKGWLALLAVGLLLAGAILWGWTGSITTRITGQGILLNDGGVFSLNHDISGRVLDVRFTPGDMVNKGDVIARIEQPELVERISDLLAMLHDLEKNQKTTSPEYLSLVNQVTQLREELVYRSRVISPVEGRILEMNMLPGRLVQPGETLATLEQYGAAVRLEAVFYVPAANAGKIRPGMEVQVSPTIVNKEEYGFILGRVTAVADYPATQESMMQTLGNQNLVALLAGQEAPLQVLVDLAPDSNTFSGYKWSSPSGPPIMIPSGTLVRGAVVIARERPINKVIPFLEVPVEQNGGDVNGGN